MGRPRVYSGRVIGVKLSGITEIKIRAAAQERGITLSDVIRETLEPVFGDGAKEDQAGTRGE